MTMLSESIPSTTYTHLYPQLICPLPRSIVNSSFWGQLMKTLKVLIATLWISGISSIVAVGQEGAAPQLQTPNAVSVAVGASHGLRPGDTFIFQLRFDVAPEGFGMGSILCEFKKVDELQPSPNDGQYTAAKTIDLHDGQGIYTVDLPITVWMQPGKWKLVRVSIGRSDPKPMSIPDNVTFEIPTLPPVVVKTEGPASVNAGQVFPIKVTLDRFPEIEGNCALAFSGMIYRGESRPTSTYRLDAHLTPMKPAPLNPKQLAYELSGALAPDIPTGAWGGDVGFTQIAGPTGRPDPCRYSELKGNTHFTFVVKPSPNLVTPSSATVLVNPSQIDLLRGEADRLKAKAEHLKEQLNSANAATNKALLQSSVKDVLGDLDQTVEKYKERGMKLSDAKAVNAFFDDIRFDYGEALNALANESTEVQQFPSHRVERVSFSLGSAAPARLSRGSEAVLGSISHNARAYLLAASSGTMNYDLEVSSNPKGAEVSYRQRTEPNFHPLDHETDWRIPSLYRATYFIRFQKPGYAEKVITFDGGSSTSTSVHADLVRQGRTR
jgi:hypothetical protein